MVRQQLLGVLPDQLQLGFTEMKRLPCAVEGLRGDAIRAGMTLYADFLEFTHRFDPIIDLGDHAETDLVGEIVRQGNGRSQG